MTESLIFFIIYSEKLKYPASYWRWCDKYSYMSIFDIIHFGTERSQNLKVVLEERLRVRDKQLF